MAMHVDPDRCGEASWTAASAQQSSHAAAADPSRPAIGFWPTTMVYAGD